MKRLAAALVLVALLALGACPALASTPGTLLIWADEVRSQVLLDLARTFEAEYGIPVRVQEMGFGDIRDTLNVAAPAGEGPDILVGAHDWLGQLVTNGLLEPIQLGEKADAFLPTALEAWTYDGVLYGLPYATEAIGLFYNKALVPRAPATFEEMIELARAAADRSQGIYGYALPIPDPYHTFPSCRRRAATSSGPPPRGAWTRWTSG